MPDIFNRSTDTYGGSFAADQAKVTFPALAGGAGAEVGLLVQNLSANYTQQITRFYEVGSSAIYLVGGRTAGQASMGRLVGPKKIAKEFYSTYGDVCRARTNTLHFSAVTGCDSADGSGVARTSYTAHFVVITTIALSLGVQDMVISEQLQMMFSSFLYN
jgi:hypothetical protein